MRCNRMILAAACVALTAVLLTGCGEGEAPLPTAGEESDQSATGLTTASPETTTASPETTTVLPEGTEEAPEATRPEPSADICSVDTPYGELHFRAQWSDYMQIRQEQEGDRVRVYFLARLNEKDYPLFDLVIWPGAEETAFPVLTDAMDVRHWVEVNMEESVEHEELDDNSQRILYAMQEEINFIIENLS